MPGPDCDSRFPAHRTHGQDLESKTCPDGSATMIDAATIESDRARSRERWYQEGFYRRETLSEALETAARVHPHTRFCFHSEAGVLETTTADICAEGRRLAGALYAIGMRSGDVLSVQLPSWRETAVLY